MKGKHQKHAKLTKPVVGKFARNEWAIIGAPCGEIRKLVERIARISSAGVAYVDEAHDKEAMAERLSVAVKMGEGATYSRPGEWNDYLNYSRFNSYDLVLVNGNHFKAKKQIVILDERKKESLSRKLDRLTDVRLILTTDEVEDEYDFLRDETSSSIPKLHINDVEGIHNFILQDMQVASVKGLVLAGGKSVRMGEDKGGISYHGVGQARHMHSMLEGLGISSYISCTDAQQENYEGQSTIKDRFIGLGPFGAIASAFMTDPNCAWLVVPCDLPLLDSGHIATLTLGRNPMKHATAYINRETGLPEPLISIWEPKMYQTMMGFLTQGYSCPRKVLINSDVELLQVEDQQFMMNVNTQEEKRRAQLIIEEQQ